MIDAKQAFQNAKISLKEFYPQVENIKLEELEIVEDEPTDHYWNITLSFRDIDDFPSERKYKRFHIDAQSGDVKAMKIREFNAPPF